MNTTMEAQVCRNYTESWVNVFMNPRKTVDRVEGCVIVVAVFMIALAILSPRRRQSRSIIIRYGVSGVFILSFPLLSYTMGLMQAGQIKNELYPVWALFLAILFGGTISMSAQSLDQNKQVMKLYCDFVSFAFCGGTVLELASKPSPRNGIRWLASYMKHEHKLSDSYNPHTMQGYKYPVMIHGTPIKLERIWCDNIGILSSSNRIPPIRRLKDLCLSFALFHLVVRRYFGYTCPESKLDKTRDLVLRGLLQTEQDYERAFQVIEAELAFLYDFFFTKYAHIMYGGEVGWYAMSLSLTFISIVAGTVSLSILNRHVSILDHNLVEASTRDVVVTIVALVTLSIFQFLQIWSYCVSDWAKVSLVCKYATHPSWQGNDLIEKLLLRLGRPHRWLRYWRNNLGQYSVLDSYSSSCWGRLKHLLPSGKAGKPVELSMEVKRAVAHTIKSSANGHLSNGTSALMRHAMSNELCWACQINDEFTATHSILVWHIATSFCEISETIIRPDDKDVYPNKIVAAILSKYCTYLVAFAPKLLPGSAAETECTLDELVKDAEATLQGLISPREKYEKLGNVPNVVDAVPPNVDAVPGETTSAQLLSKGVTLGKALESMENQAARWDLLAEFWAEMLVYIAPSDNAAAHIELLAEGASS